MRSSEMWRHVGAYIAGCFRLVAQSAATCSRRAPLADFSILKMEKICYSETLVDRSSTRRHTSGDNILFIKSYFLCSQLRIIILSNSYVIFR
jgi:hypothetical protein